MNKEPEDRYHDSVSGKFVSEEYAKENPDTTVLVDHEKKKADVSFVRMMEQGIDMESPCIQYEVTISNDFGIPENIKQEMLWKAAEGAQQALAVHWVQSCRMYDWEMKDFMG